MKFLLALSIVLFGCTAPITSSRPLKAREFAAGIGYSMDFSQKRDISSAGWSIWMGYGFGNGIDVFSGPLDLVTFPIASFELLRGKPIRSFPTGTIRKTFSNGYAIGLTSMQGFLPDEAVFSHSGLVIEKHIGGPNVSYQPQIVIGYFIDRTYAHDNNGDGFLLSFYNRGNLGLDLQKVATHNILYATYSPHFWLSKKPDSVAVLQRHSISLGYQGD